MNATPVALSRPVRWVDPKRFLWPVAALSPCLPLFTLSHLHPLVGPLGWWLPILGTVTLVPAADWVVGSDPSNPPEPAGHSIRGSAYYRWCTYLFLPLQYLSLIWCCRQWADSGLSHIDRVGLALAVGWVGALALNVGHELGHTSDSAERRLCKIALAQVAYGHFYVAHNRGHHLRVATPQDPSSARLGEGYWRFLLRVVAGRPADAWRSETRRLARRGHTSWSVHNDVLNSWVVTVVLYAASAVAFGAGILPYLALQAAFGICVLEAAAYLEHYGLLRRRRPDGRYERPAHRHSWNSDAIVSGVMLFQSQRHSDHHVHPLRPYPTLRHVDQAPQLPAGFVTMIVLAWIPPLWRRVMDPKVVAHYGGDVTLANIHPPARARLLARYGGAA
ncbi:alkane 1-monooxygenase [Streptomyces sp. NPDC026206]|uniref:alkane 1-monooxygenase n=1 Tax=Streptomyces sp. NPDC026206 TaxID=3157089 RepID=UPI0033DCB27D